MDYQATHLESVLDLLDPETAAAIPPTERPKYASLPTEQSKPSMLDEIAQVMGPIHAELVRPDLTTAQAREIASNLYILLSALSVEHRDLRKRRDELLSLYVKEMFNPTCMRQKYSLVPTLNNEIQACRRAR